MKSRTSDGQEIYPLGRHADGFLIYSPEGYMSALLCDPDREKLGTADRLAGTDQQLAGAARGCISYAGRYEVREKTVRHDVLASLTPDWVGTTLERRYELEGERLILTTPQTVMGGREAVAVLVWERVSGRDDVIW
jgi:lipocalin-like protein